MTAFLFWNVYKRPLGWLVAQIAREHDIDVILLAECSAYEQVLEELHLSTSHPYIHHPSRIRAPKVEVFSRFPVESVKPLGDYEGLSFRALQPPGGVDILLVGAHLRSKLHTSDQDQMSASIRLNQKIREREAHIGHQKTVVVGDFNMNPFEGGLVAASGFHAIASRQIAQQRTRKMRGEVYHFFYNPMWGHFGDRDDEPPGTYFRNKSAEVNLFWHMFDQILVRPDLLPVFPGDRVQIITSAGGETLLTPRGRPNEANISDHLPITFVLNLTEETNDL